MVAFNPLPMLTCPDVLTNMKFFESVERIRVRLHSGKLPAELRNKVKFPGAARAVSALEVHLGQRFFKAREGNTIGPDAMHTGVSARKNGGTRGHADRVLDTALGEHNAGPGQAVKIWRVNDLVAGYT